MLCTEGAKSLSWQEVSFRDFQQNKIKKKPSLEVLRSELSALCRQHLKYKRDVSSNVTTESLPRTYSCITRTSKPNVFAPSFLESKKPCKLVLDLWVYLEAVVLQQIGDCCSLDVLC